MPHDPFRKIVLHKLDAFLLPLLLHVNEQWIEKKNYILEL